MTLEFLQDTSIVISAGTLITMLITVVKYTSKLSTFKKEIELSIKQHDERLRKLDDLDLDSRLTKMDTDLERIKTQFLNIQKSKKK